VKKRILILTASFGEGHNSAARGVRDGLARVAPDRVEVELRDLFAETYGPLNELVRRGYLALVNLAPRAWGTVYRWLDRKKDFDTNFRRFTRLKEHFAALLDRFRPDVVVAPFPAYPYLLHQILGSKRLCKSVVVVTDSITVNSIWYRCVADYFLVPNERSAAVLRAGGIAPEKIRTFGFPVSPKFADFTQTRRLPSTDAEPRILYMINTATRSAPELVQRLADLDIDLTVTIGRDDKLRAEIAVAAAGSKTKILGWTDELPRILDESHLLIGKAGGATVQETIAAGCPMIINHVVSGQEEGNAQLIVETNSGVIALSSREVVTQIQRAFANNAKQWREWSTNISRFSRPRASLEIAGFLLSI
jgi:UDP-N-acetylglucosamine:LPS N-acetylglucosamine transferase